MAIESYDFLVSEIRVSLDKGDEIKKLILEENLSEIKRAQIILTKGQQRQKLAIYSNLGRLLKEGFNQLYIVVQADLMEQSEELIVAAGISLKNIKCYSKELMPLVLHFIQLYNMKYADAWIPTFGNLIHQFNYKDYQDHIEKIIIEMSTPRQPEVGRLIGAMLIIQVANLLGDKIQGPLLDRVRQLCNDNDSEVRSIIAGDVFSCLIERLSPCLIHQYLQDKFLPLIYDNSPQVKKQMIQTLFLHYQKLNAIECVFNATQMFIDCLSTQNEDVLSTSLAYCGVAFLAIKDQVNLEFKQNLINLFVKFGQHQSQIIRYYYLYNLPGFLTLIKDVQLNCQLIQPFCIIVDEDEEENRIFACSILHEMIKPFDYSFIQTQIFFIITNVVGTENLKMILQIQFAKIIETLLNEGYLASLDKIQKQFKTIFQDFAKLFEKCHGNYKTNEQFLTQVRHFMRFVKPRQFVKYYLPILYKQQTCNQNESIAMEILAHFFFTCQDYEIQQNIKDTMNQQFYKGSSNKKIKYLWFINALPKYISKKQFNYLNFNIFVNLYADKIVDVVIHLIKILPHVVHYLIDQSQYKLLKSLKGTTIEKLVDEMIVAIESNQIHVDEVKEKKLQEKEDKVQQDYLNSLKANKQCDSSQSIDSNSKYKKRPAPKLAAQTAKKQQSTSQMRIGVKDNTSQPSSRSQDRSTNQVVARQQIEIQKFKSRPSGFNKF
ncbi:unnamed protein product [Paramecium octaurelia]|uniref:Uncharacterized protein n=1 Tax=Paramecium octaurelia TaxID=43137 RepID=A0A8S1RZ33_PAROT|nr:unnamed protein product [Paramecium octaurelia]